MAATIANVAKGRLNEFVNRVNGNDPANSVLVLVLLKATPSAIDTLRDYDTLSAMLAVETECDFTNYARIVLDDTDVSAPTVDDVNNRQTWDIADQVITSAGGAVNNDVQAAVLCYDSDSTAGDDSQLIPIWVTRLDAAVSTTGENFDIIFNASGLWRARESA